MYLDASHLHLFKCSVALYATNQPYLLSDSASVTYIRILVKHGKGVVCFLTTGKDPLNVFNAHGVARARCIAEKDSASQLTGFVIRGQRRSHHAGGTIRLPAHPSSATGMQE